ncbi:MAG: hypothetical protein WCL14_06570 [Bacteroidota bacterium]
MKKLSLTEKMVAERMLQAPLGEKMISAFIKKDIIAKEKMPTYIFASIIVGTIDFVKQNDGEYADQLDKFATELEKPACKLQYGYNDAFKEEARKDADYNRYTFTKRDTVKNYVTSWTAKKNEVRHGDGLTVTAFQAGTDVSAPPLAVPPGNEGRFRAKAKWLKDQTTTTEAAEDALGISTAHVSTDPTGAKPDLTCILIAGGHPQLKYTKGTFQGIELEVDRGDGLGFVHLAEPSNITYTDNGALPLINQAKVWKYRAIYKLNDEHIGDWCNPISVTVHGV